MFYVEKKIKYLRLERLKIKKDILYVYQILENVGKA